MAVYYLSKEPHLFEETVDSAFRKLKEQREAVAASADNTDTSSVDLVLSKRIQEVKDKERALVVEDLMYVCILDRFRQIGVKMLPQLGPMHEDLDALKALTEGVHTKEAIEMVKEHMLGVLGPASVAYGDTVIKMSKLQSAQGLRGQHHVRLLSVAGGPAFPTDKVRSACCRPRTLWSGSSAYLPPQRMRRRKWRQARG